MKPLVYIDGSEGTTGLQIHQRLAGRTDLELLTIDPALRKDPAARAQRMNQADIVFLCLPDAAAREAVGFIDNPRTRVIDASTAHRVAPGWVYGFPELSPDHRAAIAGAGRVANPGCHATGFISLVYPLVAAGVLPPDTPLSCFSLTGYSGGGKKMIADYEAPDRPALLGSPGIYGLGQDHKHLPEMQRHCALTCPPVFSPIVADYYKGMATTLPLHRSQLRGVEDLRRLREIYQAHYAGQPLIRVAPEDAGPGPKLYGAAGAGRDSLCIAVSGNDAQCTVTALFDNLGKGASGAAVQNMNLMLGFPETTGLEL